MASKLSKADITELKSLKTPPQAVGQVFHAVHVLLLLGYSERDSKDWARAKKCMADLNFLSRLKSLGPASVPTDTRQKVQLCLSDLTPEKVRKVSSAAASLYDWLIDGFSAVAMACQVSKEDISLLKSLAAPPQAVKEILSAVLLILGFSDRESKDWKFAKKTMASSSFLDQLQSLDPSSVSADTRQKAQEHLTALSPEKVKNVAAAASGMYSWTINIVG